MRTRTLLLLGAVTLTAPACGGRLLSGTVSLSPGQTVWSGQPPSAAGGQEVQTRPGARSAGGSRAVQNRARGEQRSRARQARIAPGSVSVAPTAPEATGTAGTPVATVAPSAPAMAAGPAATTSPARSPATIQAGLVRHFQSTPKLSAALAGIVIVAAVLAVHRYRRPASPKGTVHPFTER
jgi:hypothetical protein